MGKYKNKNEKVEISSLTLQYIQCRENILFSVEVLKIWGFNGEQNKKGERGRKNVSTGSEE
ncbi:MAG: hypothetical protein Q7S70_00220 [bacterium]|nr:hypothetical protein [bacterium]